MPNNDSHQHVVKTSAQWNDRAVEYWVVPRGCLCVELTSRGKTKLKVGEGNKYYAQLPYICDIEDLSDYYTKEEINNLFNNLNRMAIMSTEEYDEKSDLPLTGNKLGDVRFVKSSSPSLKLDPDVYLWNGHKWIFVGYDIIDIDLSQYIKREEFEPVAAKVDEMYPKMHTHENKETLDRIEEPYTTAEKDKLDSLENYDDTEIRALIRQATHVHPNKSILDQIQQPFKNADKAKLDSLENYDDTELRDRISDVEAVAHTHSNKDELDLIYSGFVNEHQVLVEFKTVAEEEIDNLNDDVADLKTKIHTHSNKNILDSTTAPYTTQDKATLDELAAITIFDGAGPTYDGFRGYVPAPLAGQETYYLRGDGTWAKVKQGGDKYKAGEGIYILSGETAADSFPFNIYSTTDSLEEYIIYGSANGVGDWDSNLQKYVITITVSSEGKQTLNYYIPLDSQLFEGDYIVYSRGIFVHYKTNLIDDNESLDNSGIDENGGLYINQPSSWYQTRLSAVYEVSDEKSYLVEYDKVYSDPGWYGHYQWNINLYDESMNVTRTIRCRYTPAPFGITPTSSEKYIRVSYPYAGDAQRYHYHFYILGENAEPILGLPRINIYSNAVNTINVTTTNKPSEIYVKVAEDEGGGTTPESDFTGIIYNDGVLDVTQDDPDNLNILTIHFRDDVTKDLTIDSGVDECVVDITQEDPDNLNELTITYADGDTTTITIPTGAGEYYAGQGIEFTHPGSESYRVVEYIKKPKGVTVTTDVIPSGITDFRCDIKYFSYIGRFTILAHNGERGSFCFSPPATNQSSSTRIWMYSAHEVWTDLYLSSSSYSADPVVAHLQWGYTMSIAYDHISNTAQRTTDILPGTNNVGFNSECDTSYYWAKFYENDILVGDLVPVIRNSDNAYGFFNKITNVFSTANGAMSGGAETGEVITIGDPSEKHITAKLGTGLTFDANDAIELDDSIKLRLNCNNEPN